jgi:hypothetical protein
MSTQADIQRLLRPLAARHHDIAVWKRAITVTAIHHCMRLVVIDNSSGLTGFRLRWGICDNFDMRAVHHLSYTIKINRTSHGIWEKIFPMLTIDLLTKSKSKYNLNCASCNILMIL